MKLIFEMYNPWTSAWLIMNQGAWESVRQSPDYEWTDMIKGVSQAGKRWDYSTWLLRMESEGDKWL